jgi:hypothetical protein
MKSTEINEICLTNNYKVIEYSNNVFEITFFSKQTTLINSLLNPRFIIGASILNDYKTIRFKSTNVENFKQYREKTQINIPTISIIMTSLIKQLKYLIKEENSCFLGYNEDDIIVIDEHCFLYLGCDKIRQIDNHQSVLFNYPFSQKDFLMAPEVIIINTLPSYVHYKTAYFSLALFLISCFVSREKIEEIYYKNNLKTNIDVNLNTNPKIELFSCLSFLKKTKLYWFLSRCLLEDPEKRTLLFI